jgi:hypothetical protein
VVCGKSLAGELKLGRQMYTSRTISAPFSFFFDSISPLAWFFLRRASFCPIILLTWWGISFEKRGRWEENAHGAELASLLCDSHTDYQLSDIRMGAQSCADQVVVVVVLCSAAQDVDIKISKSLKVLD